MSKYRVIKKVKQETIEIPYHSLVLPSFIHAYSICVEVMKKWFLEKFKDDFFKSVNVEGSHSFNTLRGYNEVTLLKRQSPALAIIPTIDLTYNRDNVDLYQYGPNMRVYNGVADTSFFKDYKHNAFISVAWEELAVTIGYKLKLGSRAKQLDTFRYIQLACRAGATETLHFDMDIHIPANLMLQLASDVGFKIDEETGKIDNIIKFIEYLNQNSLLPFLYKYRCINGNNEFFLRVPDSNMHLVIPGDISMDDGEKVDQITRDYGIEFQVAVNMMAPKYYAYHSRNEHLIIDRAGHIEGNDDIYTINSIKLPNIDNVDEHGWNKYLVTEYEEETIDKPLSIELGELFRGSEIELLLKYTVETGLSPAIFLNFRVYNDGYKQDLDIDFVNLILHVKDPVKSTISNIIVYANLQYINEQLITAKKMYEGRVT